jgi:flagellar motor protein MotB
MFWFYFFVGEGRMFKRMFFAFILFSLFVACPFDGFAGMQVAAGLDSAEGQLSASLKRDVINDTIKEYETKINLLEERLVTIKMDLEWIDLRLVDIQAQKRMVPQELIESRKRLTEQQISMAGERDDLLEMIQAHRLSLENLNRRIQQGKINARQGNLNGQSSTELFDSGSAGNYLAGGKGSNIVERDLNEAPANFSDSGFKNPMENELERGLAAKINTLEIKDWVELIDDNSGLRLEVQLPILFASGSSTTTDSYDSFLKKIAALVKPHDAFIHVKGGADGSISKKISNIDLGAKRAAAIVNRLVQYGLPPSSFKITSRGEYQQEPHSDKKSPSLKRRAEITVYFNG